MEIKIDSIVFRLTFSEGYNRYKVIGTKKHPFISPTGDITEAKDDYIIVSTDPTLDFKQFHHVNKHEIELAE